MATPAIIIIPGLWNSGPQSWQTLWQNENPSWIRLEQDDWYHADVEVWSERLDETVAAPRRPATLIAHSISCILTAFWAPRAAGRVAGAMLVAPSDSEAPDYPAEAVGFAPIPLARLPFPTLVVGSRNDRYMDFDRARMLADRWGAEFVDAGHAGHINPDSGHGPWPEGRALLENFCRRLTR